MSIDPVDHRHADYPIDRLFLRRWSPRAMSGEDLTHSELMTLFEAARWAPSSYNHQPWRFLYASRASPHWPGFLALLNESNQAWAGRAGVLAVVISKTTLDDGRPARTHSFDAGAAWENVALQATLMGLVSHAMQGFDYDRARTVLSVPADYTVEAMLALGRPGKSEELPERFRERERPSQRKSVHEIAFEGVFGQRLVPDAQLQK